MESSDEEYDLIYTSCGDEAAAEENTFINADDEQVALEDEFAAEKPNTSAAIDKNYTILTEDDISRRQNDAVSSVCGVLSLSEAAARLLLLRYNWSANAVYEAWFAAEESVRKAVGLLPENSNESIRISSSDELLCLICFENYPPERFYSAACGHRFCKNCWKSYIRTAIHDGPGCLTLRCPQLSCGSATVGLDMIELMTSKEDKKRYDEFLMRSFVEQSKNCKWCPSPGCDFAVEFSAEDYGDYSVTCNCSHSFCFNCTEESHRPVGCETLEKWETINRAESNNTEWILAYTKPCPKCKRPIEKNQGCNRMTCRCKFQFCWLCLHDWSVHGYSPCNRYKSTEEWRTKQEMKRKHLDKYTHYYERWASNHKSKEKALSDLQQMENEHLEKLSESQCLPKLMLDFVIEAWKQIVECRRILKWSYVYGYYLSEEEGNDKKLELFVYLQGQAESGLERLHHCAEKELQKFIDGGCNAEKFVEFRSKLKLLTKVTGNYFENLVGALKNELSEVDSKGVYSAKKNELSSTSKGDHYPNKRPRRR